MSYNYFTNVFIIQEIQEYIPFEIHNLFNTSEQFKEFKEKFKYLKLNEEYSLKYYNDIDEEPKPPPLSWVFNKKIQHNYTSLFDYINSHIPVYNENKQLSITIQSKIITDVSKLGKAHTLKLTYCRGLTDVSGLCNIHTLILRGCKENTSAYGNPGIMKGIEHLGKVHTLDLSYCDNITEGIKHLGNVHTLNLSNCKKITNEGIKHLGNVHTLNLSNCDNITDEGIKHLGNVHTLDLSNCKKITEGIKHLGNVHTLILRGCKNITDEGIKYLGNVHTLDLRECVNIINVFYLSKVHTLFLCGHFRPILGLVKLENKILDLELYRNIMDEHLMNLGNIHTLNLRGCDKITNEGIKHLGNVHTLNLSNCKKITNEGIKYLGDVHILNLSNCVKVSNEGIAFLGNCHTLNLFGCNDITDRGLRHLSNCKTLYLDVSFTQNISENCIRNLGNVMMQYRDKDYKIGWTPYTRELYFKQKPTYNKNETFEYLPFI